MTTSTEIQICDICNTELTPNEIHGGIASGFPTQGFSCHKCERISTTLGKRYVTAKMEDIKNIKQYNEILDFTNNNEGGLFIHGTVGTGKTHVAAAICRNLEHYVGTTAPKLMLKLKDSFNNEHVNETEIIKNYGSYPMLVLDDLGVEKSSEYVIQSLYLIIDQRYRDMRSTVITSNLSLTELAQKLDDRIASRIAGMCKIIKLEGKDRRLKGDK